MGYFRKTVRRSSAKREKQALLDAAASVHPAQWTNAPTSPEKVKEKYFRLRVDFGTPGLWGLFSALGRIRRDKHTAPSLLKALTREGNWFNAHLIAPKRVHQDAVFWFVLADTEMCTHAWKLIRLVQKTRATVLIESSDKPGRIVYRDEHQIAAIRFSDSTEDRESPVELDPIHH